MTFAEVIDRHRLVVCAGVGGVGKTTIAAAIALGAAARGRRAAVLTIDPARALARAFGVDRLDEDMRRIDEEVFRAHGLELRGTLDAGMLDPKKAWDALVERLTGGGALTRAILANSFYGELSTRFAGSTEYVAMDQLALLVESGRYDLVVLDTPPAAHAFDFVRAPERIEGLLEPATIGWLRAARLALPKRARRTATAMVRWAVARLERTTGSRSMNDIAGLIDLVDGIVEPLRQRSTTARRLVRGPETAFVLITTAERRTLEETNEMLSTARDLAVPLRALIVNRRHALPERLHAAGSDAAVDALLAELSRTGIFDAHAGYIARTLRDARAVDAVERAQVQRFIERAPTGIALAALPELDADVGSFAELARISTELLSD